jgi:hypothetical protein
MSLPRKGGTPFVQDDSSDLDESHYRKFSPITTRATAKRNAERLAAFQQTTQVSPGPSTSKGKEPEHGTSPEKTPEQLRLDRLETMMERMMEHIQETSSRRSSRRSSRHSLRDPPPVIPQKTNGPSEDYPALPTDPRDQLSGSIPPPKVQSTAVPPRNNPIALSTAAEQGQSLEDGLLKTRTDRLTRANLLDDGPQFHSISGSKPNEEDFPASMEHLTDTFQRLLHNMSLRPHEPGGPPQQPAPRIPHANPVPGNGPQPPGRDPVDPPRNQPPTHPGIPRTTPAPRHETRTRLSSVDSVGEPIVSGKVNKIPSDILQPLDPDKGATNFYCKNLERLVDIYGEPSVLAAIPKTLKGRAKDWFAANTLPRTARESVASWIIALKAAFPVDPDAWGKAQDRKYDPLSDNSVMDYFYDKVNLLRTSDEEIVEEDIKKSIWRGLPAGFQLCFEYDEIQGMSLETIGNRFLKKDPSFRKTWFANHPAMSKGQSSRSPRSERYERPWKVPEAPRSIDKAKDSKSTSSNRTPSASKSSSTTTDKKPPPPRLPREEWRKDKEGRTMTRKCQHCNGWHFDFNCPRRPKSFSIHAALNQWPDSDTENNETPTSPSDEDKDSSDSSDSIPSYSNVSVYSNGHRIIKSFSKVVLPLAEKFAVQ